MLRSITKSSGTFLFCECTYHSSQLHRHDRLHSPLKITEEEEKQNKNPAEVKSFPKDSGSSRVVISKCITLHYNEMFLSQLFMLTMTGEAGICVDKTNPHPEVCQTAQSSNVSSRRTSSDVTGPCPDGSRALSSEETRPHSDGPCAPSSSTGPTISPLLMDLLSQSPRPLGIDFQTITSPAPEKPRKRRRNSKSRKAEKRKSNEMAEHETPAKQAGVSTSKLDFIVGIGWRA